MKVTMIYASTKEGLIGNNNDLPWDPIPEDFKHFVKWTKGKNILMGSKTAESLPNGPLPKRTNYVLTRRCLRNYARPHSDGFYYINDISEIPKCDEVVIIGGAQIYEKFEGIADEIIWTEVCLECKGDTYFKPSLEWRNKEFLGMLEDETCIFWRLT